MNIESSLSDLRTAPPAAFDQAVRVGTGIADGYRVFDSPIGEVLVSFNPVGISAVDLAEGDPVDRFRSRFGRDLIEAMPPKGWDAKIERAIERGTPGDLPVDLRSTTDFRKSVLEAAATIPRGQVRPYGWLAEQVGNAGAVRAVGSTMAGNPIPLIIPCHRVVRSDGQIGKYSLGGPQHKTELLACGGGGSATPAEPGGKRDSLPRQRHHRHLLPPDVHACQAHHGPPPGRTEEFRRCSGARVPSVPGVSAGLRLDPVGPSTGPVTPSGRQQTCRSGRRWPP